MPIGILSSLVETFLSRTWSEWLDLIVQYIFSEIPILFSECAQKLFASLVVITSI